MADAVIASLPDRPFRDPELFTGIAPLPEPPGGVRLQSDDGTRTLSITSEDIVYGKDSYGTNAAIGFETLSEEFLALWQTINGALKIEFVRRIGVVAEHRVPDVKAPAKVVWEQLSKFPVPRAPARYQCQFEKRTPLPDGGMPDTKTSDFVNVIYSIYDSAVDVDRPVENAINCNIDVQRYYTPVVEGGAVGGSLRRLKEQFDGERHEFYSVLAKLGISTQ